MNRDVNKVVDLHPELRYKIISEAGSIMSDGFRLPHLPDGMGSFNVDNNIVLVRNHELDLSNGMKKSAFNNPKAQMRKLGSKHYDKNAIGGTTTVVLDKSSKNVIMEYLSLSGTDDNCSGGVTPWGTWLTCEESIDKKKANKISHGYVFEVDPRNNSLSTPIPLKNMGRFYHEDVAFDKFQNAYLTEDRDDGLIYKFSPKRLNNLKRGDLFALKLKGEKDSRNWRKTSIEVNKRYLAEWVKIEDVDPDDDTMRYEGLEKGATPFSRPEGIIADRDSLYICCTSGGPLKRGQIWKIIPVNKKETQVELWYEVQDGASLNMPDNIVVAPWGDLIVCEDNSKVNRLWG
ncbi:MAG: alkaline phosphatase PhoX, partial [Candidatus Neomarinimicrobiota bacterium]